MNNPLIYQNKLTLNRLTL